MNMMRTLAIAAMAALVKGDAGKWERIVRDTGIKVD
jgi:hypothetical protein